MYLLDNIENIKQTNFPERNSFGFSEVILKEYGDKLLATLTFKVSGNESIELIKNKENQKYLKIKFFEINDSNGRQKQKDFLKETFDKIKTLQQIQTRINNFKCGYTDISAIQYNKQLSSDNTLVYKADVVVANRELGSDYVLQDTTQALSTDLSANKTLCFGAVFYIDKMEYIQQNNLSGMGINDGLLMSKAQFIECLTYIGMPVGNLKDLRVIQKTKNSLQKINLEIENKLFDKNKLKNISQRMRQISGLDSYVSDPMFSKNKNGNLHFICNFNKDLFLKKIRSAIIKIDKISFLKRELDYFNKKIINESVVNIGRDSLLKVFDNKETYCITDFNVFGNKKLFQYGMKIVLKDDRKESIRIKIIRNNLGSFDNIVSFFADKNKYDISKQTFKQPLAGQDYANVRNSINLFLGLVNDLKLLNNNELKEIQTNMFNLINWKYITIENVIYCKSIIEKFVNYLDSFLQNKNNIEITFEHWFKDILDASENPSVGYEYFSQPHSTNILQITNADLEKKIASDIFEYTNLNQISPEEQDYKYSFIAPSAIFSKEVSIDKLENLLAKSDISFVDLDSDVKSYIISKKSSNSVNFSNISDLKKQIKLKQQEYIFDKFSLSQENLYTNNLKNTFNQQENTDESIKIDDTIDATYLFLYLLNSDINKKNYRDIPLKIKPFHINALENKRDKYFSKKLEVYNPEENTTTNSYVYDDSRNWKISLKSLPRFLYLYNTIQEVQILSYENDNMIDPTWKTLTTDIFKNLQKNSRHICRLKLFSEGDYRNFKDIELPIYDSYFILNNNISENRVEIVLSEEEAARLNYQKQLAEDAYIDGDRIITEEDGTTPYFEEDLSDITLVKEYKKTLAYGKLYAKINTQLDSDRIASEMLKRFQNNTTIESDIFKQEIYRFTEKSSEKRNILNNYSTNELFLKFEKIFGGFKNILNVNYDYERNSNIIELNRIEIVDELIYRYGINWYEKAKNEIKQDLMNTYLDYLDEEKIEKTISLVNGFFSTISNKVSIIKYDNDNLYNIATKNYKFFYDNIKNRIITDDILYKNYPNEYFSNIRKELEYFYITYFFGDKIYYPPVNNEESFLEINKQIGEIEFILSFYDYYYKTNFLSLYEQNDKENLKAELEKRMSFLNHNDLYYSIKQIRFNSFKNIIFKLYNSTYIYNDRYGIRNNSIFKNKNYY